jgi:hypothetical protein
MGEKLAAEMRVGTKMGTGEDDTEPRVRRIVSKHAGKPLSRAIMS